MLYITQEKVVNLFDDQSKILSEAKYASFQGEGLEYFKDYQ